MSNKYAILFHPRSGSTLLANLCCNEPHITNYYEALNVGSARSAGLIEDGEEFDAFAQRRVIRRIAERAANAPETVFGFKFAPYQCLNATMVLSELFERNFKAIVLYRHDLVATAVSQIAAAELMRMTSAANLDREHTKDRIKSITIALSDFSYHLVDSALQRRQALLLSEILPPERRLAIAFEDLIEGTDRCRRKIEQFLGVPLNLIANASIVRHIDTPLEEFVVNYDELRTHLGTPLMQAALSNLAVVEGWSDAH